MLLLSNDEMEKRVRAENSGRISRRGERPDLGYHMAHFGFVRMAVASPRQNTRLVGYGMS